MKMLAPIAAVLLSGAAATVLALAAPQCAFAQAQIKSVPLSKAAPTSVAAPRAPSAAAETWVRKHIASWPKTVRRVAAELITRYGPPDEATSRELTWYQNAPWKRTRLYREGAKHDFASVHTDILEQTIDYRVPPEKIAALVQFDGSLIVDRTRGELSSISESEDTNFLALNVAYDVIRGERNVDQARTYYAQLVRAKMIKEPEADLQRLKFEPAPDAADPDEIAPLIRHMSGED